MGRRNFSFCHWLMALILMASIAGCGGSPSPTPTATAPPTPTSIPTPTPMPPTPTPTPLPEMSTYTNEALGFSLDYPKSWFVAQEGPDGVGFVAPKDAWLLVAVFHEIPPKATKEWLNQALLESSTEEDFAVLGTGNYISQAGEWAESEVTYTKEGGKKQTILRCTVQEGVGYALVLESTSESLEGYRATFDLVVDSFRPFAPSHVEGEGETTSYTHKTLGFSLEHPQSWQLVEEDEAGTLFWVGEDASFTVLAMPDLPPGTSSEALALMMADRIETDHAAFEITSTQEGTTEVGEWVALEYTYLQDGKEMKAVIACIAVVGEPSQAQGVGYALNLAAPQEWFEEYRAPYDAVAQSFRPAEGIATPSATSTVIPTPASTPTSVVTALEVKVLMPDGSPAQSLEVDLWTSDAVGPPDAGIAYTNDEGVAVFKVASGSYKIGFNALNFPEGVAYPQQVAVEVVEGKTTAKIIQLEAE